MIYLLVDKITPRIKFIAEILLRQLIGVNYEIEVYSEDKSFVRSNTISYTQKSKGGINIFNSGLLEETGLRTNLPEIKRKNNLLKIFENNDSSYTFDFDILAASFYLLSGYEYYIDNFRDEHDRYDESGGFEKLYHIPFVNNYAEALKLEIEKNFGKHNLHATLNSFRSEITIDIDTPWCFKNKSFFINTLGFFKDIFRLQFEIFKVRWQTVLGGKPDVYDPRRLIAGLESKNTTIFFLIENNYKYDGRYNWRSKPYRKLIKSIADDGYDIGLHPSYHSYKKAGMIKIEKKILEDICGKKIIKSRQHFLRVSLPETYKALIDAGIKEDYSACLYSQPGFKYFIDRPFKWFNLQANKAESLIIHPTMVMDRTLNTYMKLKPDRAYERVEKIYHQVRQTGGKFTLLLHNNSVSDFREWKGWQEAIKKMIKLINEG